jgi:hypothetical protein
MLGTVDTAMTMTILTTSLQLGRKKEETSHCNGSHCILLQYGGENSVGSTMGHLTQVLGAQRWLPRRVNKDTTQKISRNEVSVGEKYWSRQRNSICKSPVIGQYGMFRELQTRSIVYSWNNLSCHWRAGRGQVAMLRYNFSCPQIHLIIPSPGSFSLFHLTTWSNYLKLRYTRHLSDHPCQ